MKLLKLYSSSPFPEILKVYARIIFNFNQIKKQLDNFIPKSGNVLDYGCGYGIFANYLKLVNPSLNVYGYDISTERVNVANIVGKLTGAKFTTRFDSIKIKNLKLLLLIDVLPFFTLERKRKLLRELIPLVETGGTVFVKDTLKSPSWRFKYVNFEEKIKVALKVYGRDVKDGPFYYLTKDEFIELLESSGLEVVKVVQDNLLVYPGVFYIARKI